MTNKFSPLNKTAARLKRKILTDNPGLAGIGFVLIDSNEFKVSSVTKYLTDTEMAHSKNRLHSMAGRLAAKKAINQALGDTIPYKEIGILSSSSSRPVIFSKNQIINKSPGLALSITHEDDLASAIAISSGKHIGVGIDIARVDRVEKAFNNQKVLDYVLTGSEQEIYRQIQDAALFWSCKEAAAKALGIGIWHGGYLKDIEITNISDAIELIFKNKLQDLFMSRGFKETKIYLTTDGVYKLAIALLVP